MLTAVLNMWMYTFANFSGIVRLKLRVCFLYYNPAELNFSN